MVCEQSHPAGEQSRSLELRYYKLVGPRVWKRTCCLAGVWRRGNTGGGVGCSSGLTVSCQLVGAQLGLFTDTRTPCLLCCSPQTLVCEHLPSSFTALLLLPICCFLFPILLSDHHHLTVLLPASPLPVSSSPPSFKCRWAAEQYPGGHGDRQPPPCGLFLLLSLVLPLPGSCTLLATHILA